MRSCCPLSEKQHPTWEFHEELRLSSYLGGLKYNRKPSISVVSARASVIRYDFVNRNVDRKRNIVVWAQWLDCVLFLLFGGVLTIEVSPADRTFLETPVPHRIPWWLISKTRSAVVVNGRRSAFQERGGGRPADTFLWERAPRHFQTAPQLANVPRSLHVTEKNKIDYNYANEICHW